MDVQSFVGEGVPQRNNALHSLVAMLASIWSMLQAARGARSELRRTGEMSTA